jgi:glycosyltransferase involved in cell wall biosynthesis
MIIKVSVITPTYNQAHFIVRTIESVLSQGYPNVEYIVMDGKSTDGTKEILETYDDRIIWFSEADSGQSDAINKGLRIATGEIVCFLNSDDTFEPDAIEKVVSYFQQNPNCQWLYGKCKIIDANDNEIRKPITIYKNLLMRNYSYKKLLMENFISQPATFWRMGLHNEFGYLNEEEHYVMDYEFWCRIGASHRAGYVNSYLANFRMYEQSKSGSLANPQFDDELRVAKKYANGSKTIISIHTINRVKIIYTYKLMSILKKTIKRQKS